MDTPPETERGESVAPTLLPFGNYTRLQFVGSGGMANVYQAYDAKLMRVVALKFLLDPERSSRTRFLTEARAQARIDHENVCKIYETGEYQGAPYIAMQYIEGATLRQMAPKLSLEEKVRILKDVAHAVHAAHRVSLIHRDLKTANIMIESDPDGKWKPYVLDFGLAREMKTRGLTATGTVVGTLWYMSPEQARGINEQLDRRTDIYSLGVTLYEVLTGFLPFPDDSHVDLILKILNEDPPSPRIHVPSFPVDLETIILKCLEKDPQQRYDSARALAEDLERYLNGEPVLARKAGISYRLYKKAKRHALLFFTIVTASVLVIIFSLLAVLARWNAAEQARVARQFGQRATEMEATMRHIYMMPAHDITADKKLIAARIRQIHSEANEQGKIALLPAEYAIGSGYAVLHQDQDALAHLSNAWNGGYRDPQLAFALGLTYGKLYQKALEEAQRIKSKDLQRMEIANIDRQYRLKALDFLKRTTGLPPGFAEYARALILFYEKRQDDAIRMSEKASEQLPWLYEATVLRGQILQSQAVQASDSGDHELALKRYRLGEEALTAAAKIGESDPAPYAALCSLQRDRIKTRLFADNVDLSPLLQPVLQACNRALFVDPNQAPVFAQISASYRMIGETQASHGTDPRHMFGEASRYASKAIAIDPKYPNAHNAMGNAYDHLARYESGHGINPEPSLNLAISHYQQATSLDPNFAAAYNNLGNAYVDLASYEYDRGKNADQALADSIRSYQQSIHIVPGYAMYRNNLGNVYLLKAEHDIRKGKSPEQLLDLSIQEFEKTLQLKKDHYSAYLNLGYALLVKGHYKMDYGKDPATDFNRSVQVLREDLQLGGEDAFARFNLALVYHYKAQFDRSTGGDPAQDIASALDHMQKGLAQNDNDAEAFVELARIHILQLQDTNRMLPVVMSDLQKARAIDPMQWKIWSTQAEAEIQHAQSISNPEKMLLNALDNLQKANKVNPDDPAIWLSTARAYATLAKWKISAGKDASTSIQLGLDAIHRVQKVIPDLPLARAWEGVLISFQNKTAGKQKLQSAFATNPYIRVDLEFFK